MAGLRPMADLGGEVSQRQLWPMKRRSPLSAWTSVPGR